MAGNATSAGSVCAALSFKRTGLLMKGENGEEKKSEVTIVHDAVTELIKLRAHSDPRRSLVSTVF